MHAQVELALNLPKQQIHDTHQVLVHGLDHTALVLEPCCSSSKHHVAA
jgi:hypothetical protein